VARLFVVGFASLAALALAAAAAGSPSLRVGVQDDAWLQFGPGALEERIDRLDQMGAEVVRLTLVWRAIEPAQGELDWSSADEMLSGLRRAGIAPIVTLWGTPAWANGGRGANVPPRSARTFAAFARAAAERFPWVRRWLVWNEPNQRRWLSPPSPTLYVTRLLNPAAQAIKDVVPRATVAGGATAPRGGRGGTSPVDFIRGMGRAGARLDAYAHHPHPLSPSETPSSGGCGHCETISMATLERLLEEARRAFGARTRIWLTELGFQTNPPDRILGVGWGTQARYVAESQHRAFRAAGVDVLIQYLVRDEPSTAAWQSGLETVRGRAKPALAAYALPLVQVERNGLATTVWGQVRPGNGARRYVLQRLVGSTWKAVGAGARTTTRGYLTRTIQADKGTRLRLYDPATRRSSPALIVR
jgi:polysaccharide biosynthesis protein PslG